MNKGLQKQNAAKKAVEFAEDGFAIGLGSGSTSEHFVKFLAQRVKEKGMKIKCVSTSNHTAELAQKLGLKVLPIDSVEKIDLAVDGADQVNKEKHLVKGNSVYAFIKEKKVDYKAKKFVVIVDESKLVEELDMPVLVEVKQEKLEPVLNELKKFNAVVEVVKENSEPKVSENGNFIVSLKFEKIGNAPRLEKELDSVEGVAGNGLFSRDCIVIVGHDNGAEVLD